MAALEAERFLAEHGLDSAIEQDQTEPLGYGAPVGAAE